MTVGREKLVNGEADSSECVAGIFRITTAFFSGYAEIICRYQHLYIPFELYDGKYAQGDFNCLFAVIPEITVKAATDITGYTVAAITQRVAAIADSAYFCIKNYRVNALHFCFGIGVGNGHLLVGAVADIT